ncbi:hypothetical protein T03_1177 [Trichinella britovi]|uniref:Uncharacterized protein n=2 Tax=Trichinella TaxID=6333 RepID=A0A0V1CST0_TRIBR|nr:hypothetical protein T05_6644 [Trichinella murrelli]KRX58796.1 hypothetical protein T09_5584 [Trichinella sp. T9]KRY52162.1 hypothetical protein T03_1177 [Trichinella britovi]KRZ97321.1 hypothetical protein T08_2450 [Trichinella sp. T8]
MNFIFEFPTTISNVNLDWAAVLIQLQRYAFITRLVDGEHLTAIDAILPSVRRRLMIIITE